MPPWSAGSGCIHRSSRCMVWCPKVEKSNGHNLVLSKQKSALWWKFSFKGISICICGRWKSTFKYPRIQVINTNVLSGLYHWTFENINIKTYIILRIVPGYRKLSLCIGCSCVHVSPMLGAFLYAIRGDFFFNTPSPPNKWKLLNGIHTNSFKELCSVPVVFWIHWMHTSAILLLSKFVLIQDFILSPLILEQKASGPTLTARLRSYSWMRCWRSSSSGTPSLPSSRKRGSSKIPSALQKFLVMVGVNKRGFKKSAG